MSVTQYFFANFCINDGVNYFLLSKVFDAPSLQYVVEGVSRYPGTKFSGSRINEKPLPLTVRVVSTGPSASRADLESKIDALMAALQYRQQRLTLHSLDQRYYIADASDVKISLGPGQTLWADVVITFTLYVPYAYAATTSIQTLVSTALTSQGGGIYAAPIQSFAGGGNVFSYPIITITNTGSPNITAINLYQQTDGMQITVSHTLSTNDTLTIFNDPLNANGFTVSYNLGAPIPFSGSFFVQEPTITNWLLTAAAASQPSASISWQWIAHWAN